MCQVRRSKAPRTACMQHDNTTKREQQKHFRLARDCQIQPGTLTATIPCTNSRSKFQCSVFVELHHTIATMVSSLHDDVEKSVLVPPDGMVKLRDKTMPVVQQVKALLHSLLWPHAAIYNIQSTTAVSMIVSIK